MRSCVHGELASIVIRGEQVLVDSGSGCGNCWDIKVGFDDTVRFATVKGIHGTDDEFELAGAGAWFRGASVGVCIERGGEVNIVSPMFELGPLVVVRNLQGRLIIGQLFGRARPAEAAPTESVPDDGATV